MKTPVPIHTCASSVMNPTVFGWCALGCSISGQAGAYLGGWVPDARKPLLGFGVSGAMDGSHHLTSRPL